MHKLLIFSFFILTGNTVFSMDTPKGNPKQRSLTDPAINSPFIDKSKNVSKQKRSLSPSKYYHHSTERERISRDKTHTNRRLSSSPKSLSPRSSETFTYSELKYAIQKGKSDVIKNFLADLENNPNIQCKGTNLTLLHQAVLNTISIGSGIEIIDMLLQDPRIKSESIDIHGRAAWQYITENNISIYKKIYDQLILRNNLDLIVYAMLIINPTVIKGNNEYISKKIKSLLSRVSPKIIPSYITVEFVYNMIASRLKFDYSMIEETHNHYMKNPNYQDEYGNTYLHLAVYNRNLKLVSALAANASIYCVRNKNNQYPQSLLLPIEKIDCSHIKKMSEILFIRDSLERWISEAAEEQLLTNPIKNPYKLGPKHPLIQDTITVIKKKCLQVAKKQQVEKGTDEDGQLPLIAAQLPDYATDYFLHQRIIYHLLERKTSLPYMNNYLNFLSNQTSNF